MTSDVTESPTNALVSPQEQFWVWPIFGKTLTVPPGECAIVTGRGQSVVLEEGRHNLKPHTVWWTCHVQHIDTRPHLTRVPPIKARCKEGQQVELGLGIYWRVKDARSITVAVDPVDNLLAAAQTCMRAVVEMMPHETFAAGMGSTVIDAEVLAMSVASKLKANPAIEGLEIVNVFVTDRQGDNRYVEMARDAATVEQRMELERKERKLKLLQAETSRLQEEEQFRARIREAEIQVKVDEQLLPIKQREAEREREVEARRHRHEQILKMIEAQGLVLSKVAEHGMLEIVGDTKHRRPEEAGNSMETILRGLSSLQNMVQHAEYVPSLGAGDLARRIDLWIRLLPEIYEINQVEIVEKCRLTSNRETEECRIVVMLQGNKLVFTCGPEYPVKEPEVLLRVDDDGQEQKVTEPWWPRGATLKNIVETFPIRSQADWRKN